MLNLMLGGVASAHVVASGCSLCSISFRCASNALGMYTQRRGVTLSQPRWCMKSVWRSYSSLVEGHFKLLDERSCSSNTKKDRGFAAKRASSEEKEYYRLNHPCCMDNAGGDVLSNESTYFNISRTSPQQLLPVSCGGCFKHTFGSFPLRTYIGLFNLMSRSISSNCKLKDMPELIKLEKAEGVVSETYSKQESKKSTKFDALESKKRLNLPLKVLSQVFLSAAIPMIGFGIMDQFVMIRAGDFIDTTIGVTFGLATLTAAAVGQLCSDTCGVLSGSTMVALAQKFGFETPTVSPEQRSLLSFKLCTTSGAVFGVILGCLLGMTQLFFMDLGKSERLKKQKELDTIFEMVMSDGPKLFCCERGTLFVYDKVHNEIWSKAVFGLDQAIRLRKDDKKSFTTWVLENKKILNCPDAYLDSRFNPVYDQKHNYRTCSVLAAPIVNHKDEAMAVLMFINKDEEHGGVFTADDERMLEMMCKHIQIFMEKFNYGAEEDKNVISIQGERLKRNTKQAVTSTKRSQQNYVSDVSSRDAAHFVAPTEELSKKADKVDVESSVRSDTPTALQNEEAKIAETVAVKKADQNPPAKGPYRSSLLLAIDRSTKPESMPPSVSSNHETLNHNDSVNTRQLQRQLFRRYKMSNFSPGWYKGMEGVAGNALFLEPLEDSDRGNLKADTINKRSASIFQELFLSSKENTCKIFGLSFIISYLLEHTNGKHSFGTAIHSCSNTIDMRDKTCFDPSQDTELKSSRNVNNTVEKCNAFTSISIISNPFEELKASSKQTTWK